MATSFYRGFILGELKTTGVWTAWRSKQLVEDDLHTYEAPDMASLMAKIDENNDYGNFTEADYQKLLSGWEEPTKLGGEELEEMKEVIKEMPFMPEPGPPLPAYVHEALHDGKGMRAPISAYGRALADEVLTRLGQFMGTNFVVIEDFEEVGWASDSTQYEGALRHIMTNTDWDVEISVNFKWRQPENIEDAYIDFLSITKSDGTKEDIPEEITDKGNWSFFLNANDGIQAGNQINNLQNTGWNV